MTDVIIAALAGFGAATAVGRGATRVERWWQPTWTITRRMFAALRSINTAAFAGVAFGAAATGSVIASLAAGAVAGAAAEGVLLLLVRTRT